MRVNKNKKKRYHVIYRYESSKNPGVYYIGQTIQGINGRARNGADYLGKYKSGQYKQPKFAEAIEKYGWDTFFLFSFRK